MCLGMRDKRDNWAKTPLGAYPKANLPLTARDKIAAIELRKSSQAPPKSPS